MRPSTLTELHPHDSKTVQLTQDHHLFLLYYPFRFRISVDVDIIKRVRKPISYAAHIKYIAR